MNLRQKNIEELENAYIKKTRQFNEFEWDCEDLRKDVQRHTEDLADWVYYFYRRTSSRHFNSISNQLFYLQEEFEVKLKRFERRLEDEREVERKKFQQELDRLCRQGYEED